jgi:hypothetical protein
LFLGHLLFLFLNSLLCSKQLLFLHGSQPLFLLLPELSLLSFHVIQLFLLFLELPPLLIKLLFHLLLLLPENFLVLFSFEESFVFKRGTCGFIAFLIISICSLGRLLLLFLLLLSCSILGLISYHLGFKLHIRVLGIVGGKLSLINLGVINDVCGVFFLLWSTLAFIHLYDIHRHIFLLLLLLKLDIRCHQLLLLCLRLTSLVGLPVNIIVPLRRGLLLLVGIVS